MATALLATKLYFPPARPDFIPRPRLIARLTSGLSKPLTLVSAPAGYGKTSLLSTWRAEAGHDFPAAWLSLDALDNSLFRFLEYISAALDGMHPGLADRLIPLLRLPQPPPTEELLTALINSACKFPQDFALILDDYHTIDNPDIHHALTFLLDHLPAQMHLVLITRSDPPLPLSRLQARNQIAEIRQEHLRFNFEEASLFFKQVMGLRLSSANVNVLEERTEGWVAGLQMAGLSLHNRSDINAFINAFQGNDRYVMDYLMEEVLRNQPVDIQEFLLKTSILERLCPDACDAVMDAYAVSRRDALEFLERNHLFLISLDNQRQWYRYHHLFTDLLHYRLQREYPELIPELHARACRWFEKAGYGEEAMSHALAAADSTLAAEVAEVFMMAMLGSSRLATYARWLQSIPEEIVRSHAYLCAGWGWVSLLLSWQPDEAEGYAAMGEVALPQFTPLYSSVTGRWITPDEVRGHLTAIRAHAARMRGDYPRAIELSSLALQELPQSVFAVRCILAFNLGLLYMHIGSLEQAHAACLEAVETAVKSGENNNIALNALSVLSGICIWRGQLRQAEAFCQRAFEIGGETGGQAPDPATAYTHGWMAEVALLRHDLQTARAHLDQAIASLEQIGAQENLAFGYIYRVRLTIEAGELEEAESHVQALRDLSRSAPGFAERMPEWGIAQGNLLLAQGRLDETAQILAAHGIHSNDLQQAAPDDPAAYQRLRDWLPAYLLLARLLLAQGTPEQAYKLFDQVGVVAQAIPNYAAWLESLVFQAAILSSRRETRDAQALTERCLHMGAPEGYILPFLHAGLALKPHLRQAIMQAIEPAYAQRLLYELEEDERHRARITAAPGSRVRVVPGLDELGEPLTEREIQILRLLAAGLTSTQIADELVISVNTARSYIKNVHRKLDVHSRDEAIERALRLGLL